jgi:hypothetical protein
MSSYMPTDGASVTRTADALSWTFTARPQATTLYVKFVERGNIANAVTGSNRNLLSIGGGSNARIELLQEAATAFYKLYFFRATGAAVASTLAVAPTIGQIVELRGTISVTGSVQLHQSLDGGAEVSATASTTKPLPTAWNTAVLWLGGHGPTVQGQQELLATAIVRGIQTRATMRRLAGAEQK